MKPTQTGAEAYFAKRLEDDEYADTYAVARDRIDQIDRILRSIDSRRQELGMSKAELARQAHMRPEAVRRLLTAESPNLTISTLLDLAGALHLTVSITPELDHQTS